MAYRLASAGRRVLVLEKGRRQNPQTFAHNELEMIPRVYKHGGLQTTSDHDITIMQGCTVGGSTVINNAIWLRANLDRILPEWESRGARLDKKRILHAYADIEKKLHVTPIPAGLANAGTNIFLRGCKALGINGELLNNNRDECIACGWCNYGCAYNRKTSMLVTFIPWAESLGAEIEDECRHIGIVSDGGRVTSIVYRRHGVEHRVIAERVVVCAGAIGSSEVLLASGITGNGTVGRNFHVLGGVLVAAETREPLDSFDGIGLTSVAHDNDDYVIESFFAPPGAFSVTLGGWFATHYERMKRYRYFAQAGVMVPTTPRGTITIDKKGVTKIDLVYNSDELKLLVKGTRRLGEIFFAGGAVTVLPGTFRHLEFTTPGQLDQLGMLVEKPEDLLIGSAHPQGGNVMCDDRSKGVVSSEFRVHGYDNLFLVDASVFPSNIQTNCQATVMALSYIAADHVAG
jgi:choline dehydrogenase-like flavoprotein